MASSISNSISVKEAANTLRGKQKVLERKYILGFPENNYDAKTLKFILEAEKNPATLNKIKEHLEKDAKILDEFSKYTEMKIKTPNDEVVVLFIPTEINLKPIKSIINPETGKGKKFFTDHNVDKGSTDPNTGNPLIDRTVGEYYMLLFLRQCTLVEIGRNTSTEKNLKDYKIKVLGISEEFKNLDDFVGLERLKSFTNETTFINDYHPSPHQTPEKKMTSVIYTCDICPGFSTTWKQNWERHKKSKYHMKNEEEALISSRRIEFGEEEKEKSGSHFMTLETLEMPPEISVLPPPAATPSPFTGSGESLCEYIQKEDEKKDNETLRLELEAYKRRDEEINKIIRMSLDVVENKLKEKISNAADAKLSITEMYEQIKIKEENLQNLEKEILDLTSKKEDIMKLISKKIE